METQNIKNIPQPYSLPVGGGTGVGEEVNDGAPLQIADSCHHPRSCRLYTKTSTVLRFRTWTLLFSVQSLVSWYSHLLKKFVCHCGSISEPVESQLARFWYLGLKKQHPSYHVTLEDSLPTWKWHTLHAHFTRENISNSETEANIVFLFVGYFVL